jgi:DNA invertase Pin-like site-specific DNA recombinase
VQLTGHEMLKKLGYELVPVDAPNHFTDDTPTVTVVGQILGAVSEFEKAEIVSKLKAARTRKREETGKCEGRKGYKELDPALAREAKRFPKDGFTLAKVSSMLFQRGYKTSSGKAFAPAQISRLIALRVSSFLHPDHLFTGA